MGEGVTGNAGAGVSVDKGLIEVSFFVSGEGGDDLTVGGDLVTAEHESEEAVEGDKVGAEGVVGVFAINDFR